MTGKNNAIKAEEFWKINGDLCFEYNFILSKIKERFDCITNYTFQGVSIYI